MRVLPVCARLCVCVRMRCFVYLLVPIAMTGVSVSVCSRVGLVPVLCARVPGHELRARAAPLFSLHVLLLCKERPFPGPGEGLVFVFKIAAFFFFSNPTQRERHSRAQHRVFHASWW